MENKVTKQQNFIELRARGNSFKRTSKQLGVSKGTLIGWSKNLEIEIGNYAKLEGDALMNKYKMSKLSQLGGYGILLSRMRNELKKRDFSDTPTAKLVELELKLIEAINKNDKSTTTLKAEGVDVVDFYCNWEAQ